MLFHNSETDRKYRELLHVATFVTVIASNGRGVVVEAQMEGPGEKVARKAQSLDAAVASVYSAVMEKYGAKDAAKIDA